MGETSPIGNGRPNWRKELRSIFGNKWLTAAVVVELLGLMAAFGSMPVWGLPIAWTLSLTGILSAGGVLIVTVYFVLQYNRRPLNYIQVEEVNNLVAPHLLRDEAQENFEPKGELSRFVQGFELFWHWQYQKSIVELMRAIVKLRSLPGFVIVAECGTPEGPGARFVQVPPPVQVLGQPLGTDGEELPKNFHDLGNILKDRFKVFIFYLGADRTIRYLEMEQALQKTYYDNNTASPIIVSQNQAAPMHQLRNVIEMEDYQWEWVTP